jgi:hypothetical protein
LPRLRLQTNPKGLATLQHHQSSSASLWLISSDHQPFFTFPRELVQKLHAKKALLKEDILLTDSYKLLSHFFITAPKKELPHLQELPRVSLKFFCQIFLLF